MKSASIACCRMLGRRPLSYFAASLLHASEPWEALRGGGGRGIA